MTCAVVLGDRGFLGRHVAARLRSRCISPLGLSRASGCDLRNAEEVAAALSRASPDIIFNCAAHVGSLHYVSEFAADVVHDNMMMVLGLYRGAQQGCPEALIVNPISNCSYPGEAYEHHEPVWQDGPVHDSVLPYASTRRMIHAVSASYYKQHGMRSINWLVANAYGPGDSTDPNKVHALNGIVIRLIQARLQGDSEFVIWGSGEPLREWVYAPDAARVLVESALDGRVDEQVYPVNIAQHRGYSVTEIAQQAAEALDYEVAFTYDRSKPDGAPRKILDDRAFRGLFPDFEFTSLQEGIGETVHYYERLLPGRGSAPDQPGETSKLGEGAR